MLHTLRRACLVAALSTSAFAAEPVQPSTEGDWVLDDSYLSTELDRPLQTAGGVVLGGGIGAMTASVALFWMSSNAYDQAMNSCDIRRCVAADADHFFGIMQTKRRSAQISLGSGAAIATAGLIMVVTDATRHRKRRLAAAEASLGVQFSVAPMLPSTSSPSTGLLWGGVF